MGIDKNTLKKERQEEKQTNARPERTIWKYLRPHTLKGSADAVSLTSEDERGGKERIVSGCSPVR